MDENIIESLRQEVKKLSDKLTDVHTTAFNIKSKLTILEEKYKKRKILSYIHHGLSYLYFILLIVFLFTIVEGHNQILDRFENLLSYLLVMF